ncbi:hypothetical protein FNO01nite_23070 [Flavobacterium noncentrifugens]|uniref:Transcriptional regulatory protein, C terminal n=1 Tax=Flavobacterium noncentrifugens TaxID=1128970 RepID=A0A1G9AYL9_9FLAO|nr:winged helix-turn-helix domain-containing protein [Flavobacterium noncentrifugens]GEP51635.1 hypothetical protein FNO01nite_23070 [Flavobacterium noncentrifugens]SDK32429.1 Transcriptional regulatory protein, C terminal [Flavobacterium noncentrifugens]
MKIRYAFFLFAVFLLGGFYFLIKTKNKADYNLAKREIEIRKIGDAILLQAGDSTSRVLPVKKLSDKSYELQFEKKFAIEPNALVAIIRKTFAESNDTDYIVNVLDCDHHEVVYGYDVSNRETKTATPCLGRNLPYGCYMVYIKFRETAPDLKKEAVSISLLAVILFFPLIVFHFRKKKMQPGKLINSNQTISIGAILFDVEKKHLITTEKTMNLTTKENRLLLIFAENPNETIDRSRLQKEIWEDDGIIVGRSLDVFISKLRKKLESDVSVQLINVHGKGYKLQIKSVVD